jgi:hypothetical protein
LEGNGFRCFTSVLILRYEFCNHLGILDSFFIQLFFNFVVSNFPFINA